MNGTVSRLSTIGSVDHGKTALTCAILQTLCKDVTLSKPAPVCDGIGGERIGFVDSINYSEIENRVMAHMIMDDHVSLDFETQSFSFGHSVGKTYLSEMLMGRSEEELSKLDAEAIVPISVYNMIRGF